MAKPNVIDVHILPGGNIKIESGKVDPAIHGKVEIALKRLMESMGKEPVKITHLPHSHRHTGHHIHGGQGIQH